MVGAVSNRSYYNAPMIVHFGLQLGGMQAARAALPAGETVLGPGLLLNVLETELGLPPVQARPAEALLAYQACLAELDGPARFYHRSLAVDALAVARRLLGWRAEWHEAGWRGAFDGAVSERLADIAAVERLAAVRVPLDAGQRLARIAAALERGYRTQIERLVLHEMPAALPAAWRRVLDHFVCEVAAGVDPPPAAPPGSDLGRVQRALRDGTAGTGKITLAGDDSLILLRGVSRDLTAQTVAEFLLGAAERERSVIIAERDGIIVDNAFERVGLPRAGFQHFSPFRAVTQLPLLCLGLVWRPLDVHLLLQFLLHPVGPLPAFARGRLAAAVAAEPGIGGSAWRQALDAIAAQAAAPARAESAPPDAASLVADIRYWLECERYAPAGGAPIAVLADRTARLAGWLRRRQNALADAGGGQALYRSAAAESEALLAALQGLAARGAARLERIALEQLIEEVCGAAPDPASFAQVGRVPATTAPGTITAPWDTVVWWDLTAPAPRAAAPWSAGERAELAAAGVALEPARARIHRETRAWLRPVMNAAAKLILVLHERDEGRHPLLGQIENVAEGFREIDVEQALLAGGDGAALSALGVVPAPLALRPLPVPRRWWSLPADCRLEARPAESYTSLAKLIDYPHEWVLRYAADLRPGRAANLTGGALLYGNLAHRLFQRYFTEHPDWASAAPAVEPWLERTLPRLIEHEGAPLLEPGMGIEREFVTATLENALARLLEHFDRAGIERVAAEQWHEAPCGEVSPPGGPRPVLLRGAVDLALTDRRGREIVLDVKWGGEDRRGAELAKNRHLQLAAYAYLRKASLERADWPQQAYFIVTTGNVLAQDTAVFPDAVPFPPAAGNGGMDALWARVAASVDWRRRQLDEGLIEVNVPGTEPDALSVPPATALAAEERPDPFDDFVRLTGWEPGQ